MSQFKSSTAVLLGTAILVAMCSSCSERPSNPLAAGGPSTSSLDVQLTAQQIADDFTEFLRSTPRLRTFGQAQLQYMIQRQHDRELASREGVARAMKQGHEVTTRAIQYDHVSHGGGYTVKFWAEGTPRRKPPELEFTVIYNGHEEEGVDKSAHVSERFHGELRQSHEQSSAGLYEPRHWGFFFRGIPSPCGVGDLFTSWVSIDNDASDSYQSRAFGRLIAEGTVVGKEYFHGAMRTRVDRDGYFDESGSSITCRFDTFWFDEQHRLVGWKIAFVDVREDLSACLVAEKTYTYND